MLHIAQHHPQPAPQRQQQGQRAQQHRDQRLYVVDIPLLTIITGLPRWFLHLRIVRVADAHFQLAMIARQRRRIPGERIAGGAVSPRIRVAGRGEVLGALRQDHGYARRFDGETGRIAGQCHPVQLVALGIRAQPAVHDILKLDFRLVAARHRLAEIVVDRQVAAALPDAVRPGTAGTRRLQPRAILRDRHAVDALDAPQRDVSVPVRVRPALDVQTVILGDAELVGRRVDIVDGYVEAIPAQAATVGALRGYVLNESEKAVRSRHDPQNNEPPHNG
jgi:hypothetical protein